MLRLLGSIEAGDGLEAPDPVTTPRLRLVLSILGAHAGQRVTVDKLTDILWPDTAPPTAATALQGYISKIRRAFEPDLAVRSDSSFLRTDANAYVLSLPDDQLDTVAFTTRARNGIDTDDEAVLIEALGLWRGDPFAEFVDEPWALGHSTELRQLRLRAAQRRYALAITAGRDSDVVEDLRIDLGNNPFEERLAGLLMTALYRLGDQRAALDVFAATRKRLLDDLGLDPTPDLRSLETLILQHDASLLEGMRIRPPVTATPSSSRPAMFGRSDDLDRLRAALDDHRLVTLSGPGGVGKTRLAQELVDVQGDAHFVDLSPSANALDALGQLRAALGVDGDPLTNAATSAALAAEASCRLLVLDNCEHLLPELSGVISDLLDAPGSFRILTTSRQNLGLGAEHTLRLAPLVAPDSNLGRDLALPELAELPGIRILTSRSGQQLDEHNAPHFLALHQRLDGLPLALELAAFRIRTIGITDLDPLSDDRSIPAPSDFPERHRSLEQVLSASIDQLDPRLRSILESMSVFAGPVPLEAIVRLLHKKVDAIDVRIGVAELVNCSLVTMTSTSSGVRYGLLETVRSRCRRSLDADGHLVSMQARHTDVVRRAAGASVGSKLPVLALDDLDHEVGAMLSRFELDRAEPQDHFGVLMPVATYWYGTGRVAEARLRLRTALDLYPNADPFLIGTASALLGMISFGEGAFNDLADYTGTALGILEPVGLPGLDFVRAGHHVGKGEISEARQSIDAFLTDPMAAGRPRLAGLEVASTAAWFDGDPAAAITFFREQHELARREHDHYFEAHALRGEGMMLAMSGEPEMGLELCRRANDVVEHTRAARVDIETLAASAVIRHSIGDLSTAGTDAWSTLERCVRNFDAPAVALTVPIAAKHALHADDSDSVARLTGWFDALCRTTGLYASPSSRQGLDDVVSATQADVDETRWIQLRADGAALGLGGVLAARSTRSGT